VTYTEIASLQFSFFCALFQRTVGLLLTVFISPENAFFAMYIGIIASTFCVIDLRNTGSYLYIKKLFMAEIFQLPEEKKNSSDS